MDQDSFQKLAPWLATIVSLLTLAVTPIFQRSIALRQQRASVVAANRIRWIEDFRKDVATFCELAHHVEYNRIRMYQAQDARDKMRFEEHRKEIIEKTVPLNTVYHHLLMRCNPNRRRTQKIAE